MTDIEEKKQMKVTLKGFPNIPDGTEVNIVGSIPVMNESEKAMVDIEEKINEINEYIDRLAGHFENEHPDPDMTICAFKGDTKDAIASIVKRILSQDRQKLKDKIEKLLKKQDYEFANQDIPRYEDGVDLWGVSYASSNNEDVEIYNFGIKQVLSLLEDE